MFWGTHHLWGQVLGCPPPLLGEGSLPLLPAQSPCSQLAPLAPNGQGRVGVYYTMFWGPHHLCGGKGQAGSKGSELGVKGASRMLY